VVVLANTAPMRISAFGEQVTRIVLGLELEPRKPRPVVDVDPAVLASYAGFDMLSRWVGLMTVTVQDGKLLVQATGQEKFQLHAIANMPPEKVAAPCWVDW
jgi:hypothetical protein